MISKVLEGKSLLLYSPHIFVEIAVSTFALAIRPLLWIKVIKLFTIKKN